MRRRLEPQNPDHRLSVVGPSPDARNPQERNAGTKAPAIHLTALDRASTVAWQDGQPQRPEGPDVDCDARMCPGLLPAKHIGERHGGQPARDYLQPTGCGRRATRALTPKRSHRWTQLLLQARDGSVHPEAGLRLDRPIPAEGHHKVDATLCEWQHQEQCGMVWRVPESSSSHWPLPDLSCPKTLRRHRRQSRRRKNLHHRRHSILSRWSWRAEPRQTLSWLSGS